MNSKSILKIHRRIMRDISQNSFEYLGMPSSRNRIDRMIMRHNRERQRFLLSAMQSIEHIK